MKNQPRIIYLTFCLFTLFISCKKDQISESDNFIFGTFYGECMGEQCIEIFKLENNKLYEDTNDKYPSYKESYKGDFKVLNNDKYLMVKDIGNKIPDSLFLETSHVIGQPDAGDWGGIYIGITKNEKNYFWLIDTQKSNLPNYLHTITDEVMQAVSNLK